MSIDDMKPQQFRFCPKSMEAVREIMTRAGLKNPEETIAQILEEALLLSRERQAGRKIHYLTLRRLVPT